jgi:hypothetical protein
MANQFSKTRIAAAVSAAALGAGLSAPAGAVVVVGGNDGWEVSFDGNVNAFYTVGDFDAGYVTETVDKDSSRVHSGFLPAFFSFNVKTPTIGGMTGTGRISFAPTIHTGGSKTQFTTQGGALSSPGPITGIGGAAIDTREVLANLSGAFGEVSFGRTLSLFGRNAILNDMTLFGVGFVPGADQFGSVTFGRAGHGYTYPDFTARFQYTTPVVAGFQAAVGLYDPSTIDRVTVNNFALLPGGLLDETDSPRFEGELSYSNIYNGFSTKLWLDGTWQDVESSCTGVSGAVSPAGVGVKCGKMTSQAWGVGGKLGYMGFEVVGYYHDNQGLGLTSQFNSNGVYFDQAGNIHARDGDGYYVQGMYTFTGKTKVGVSYGEGNLDSVGATDSAANGLNGAVERSLWTVGVYHDVSSWLRVVAEYNHGRFKTGNPGVTPEADTFSVGGFLFW